MHKSFCNNPNSKQYNYPIYRAIRANGGWEAFQHAILETVHCECRQTALAAERRWLEAVGAGGLNKDVPGRTHQESSAACYAANREARLQYQREYNARNREAKRQRDRAYQARKRAERLAAAQAAQQPAQQNTQATQTPPLPTTQTTINNYFTGGNNTVNQTNNN